MMFQDLMKRSELKEWSDNDDINHVYGAVVEEEGTQSSISKF